MTNLNSYTKIYTITTNYLDRFDTLSPKGILDLFQDIASRHAAMLNADYSDMMKLGLMWVIARNHIKIVKDMPYGGDVIVETWPLKPSHFYYDRMYLIKTLGGDTLVKGRSRWILMNHQTRRMESSLRYTYPQDDYLNVDLFDDDYPIIAKLQRDKPSFTHQVLLSELDHNMHFNNSRYAEVVYNILGQKEKSAIEDMYLYYHSEVKLDDVIVLQANVIGNYTYISGYVGETLVFSSLVILR